MCTNITIKSQDNNIIVGRSMENAVFMNSKIFFRAKGYHYKQDASLKKLSTLFEKSNTKVEVKSIKESLLYEWKGKYSFVGINALEMDIATQGMNSEGLVTGDMTLTESEYQPLNEKKNTLLIYLYLTNWILSTCATCEDVKKNLKDISVINPFENMDPGFFTHFPVNDALGKAIVIEYVKGELQIHDNNKIGVLTNDPLFSWQCENLKNYINISPINAPKKQTGNRFTVASTVQGSGFTGLPGSSTPMDRFVKASMMTNYTYQPTSTEDAINTVAHIMNTVDIPRGTSRIDAESTADKQKSDFTQWITISDTKNLKYYIRGYYSPLLYSIDFKEILTSYANNMDNLNNLKKPIPTDRLAINITEEFICELKPDMVY